MPKQSLTNRTMARINKTVVRWQQLCYRFHGGLQFWQKIAQNPDRLASRNCLIIGTGNLAIWMPTEDVSGQPLSDVCAPLRTIADFSGNGL
jgi:hypothetical protein